MRTEACAESAQSSFHTRWLAAAAGAVLVLYGARRRSTAGAWAAAAAAPLFYRAVTGHWPAIDGRHAVGVTPGGESGVEVRDAIRVQRPVAEVYRYWRRLEHLPRFMRHLDSVTEHSDGRSHWVANGPAGRPVRWEAEIVHEIENRTLAWRSLPGSDIVTAGAVDFAAVRGGSATQVTVHLQYLTPLGRAGAWLAMMFGRAPSQTVREDLRRFKQLLEAGEVPLNANRAQEVRQ